ncbi:MAG: TRAP transporter small permease [Syntrophorhabdaceae bacterium]|nr:TRAP transporter small permease [Syntrophorhabdaceae bacterium]
MVSKNSSGAFNGLIFGGGILSGIFVLITAILVAFEVFMRYVVRQPTEWTFDLTLFLIIYAAYIGSAFTMREGKHVRVEFLVEWLAKYPLLSFSMKIFCNTLAFLFWAFATWTTYRETVTAYQLNDVTMSYLRWPLAIPLAAVVFGGVLILIQLIRDTAGHYSAFRRRGR